MKSRRCWRGIFGALAAACLSLCGCGGGSTKVTIVLNTTAANLLVNQSFLFSVIVTGATDTSATFKLTSQVAPPAGSTTGPTGTPTACSPGCGTLVGANMTSVTYQAPAVIPNPALVITLTATSNADNRATATATINLSSGIIVSVLPNAATIGTGETFPFHVTLTNDSTPNDVNWSITGTGGGTVDANGVYTAPATVPNPAIISVVATSKLDPNATGSASVTIVTAGAVSFGGINPGLVPLGSTFQDIYLQTTNARSTITVRFKGNAMPSSQVKVVNSSVVRLRLIETDLETAGSFPISIDGASGGPFNVQISPVQPSLIAAPLSPGFPNNTTVQNANSGQITINGGFFGPSSGTGPVITANFNNAPHSFQSSNSRQVTMTLNSGDFATPGTTSVSVASTVVPGSRAASNFTVQPDPTVGPPGPVAGSPVSLGGGAGPTAVAIDTTMGIAIVSNTGNNTLQEMNFNGSTWVLRGSPIALPGSPNGVSVDEQRHVAGVAVSTANGSVRNVTIVDLVGGTIVGTVDVSSVTTALPFAVGLDPGTGLGIVAFSSTNIGAVFNFDSTASPTCAFPGGVPPFCVTGVTSVNTGAKPQVAMEPRLRWAFITPGGAGELNIIDLGVPQTQVAIAAANASPAGAVRTSNIVTITTAVNHNLSAVNPGTVLISGVADSSFNGTFAVTSVIDARTFTYSQTLTNATSGGGTVSFGEALLTFGLSTSTAGIAMNRLTGQAILADAGGNSPSVLNTLDETTVPINIGHPSLGAAFQPFTNVAVVVKPGNLGQNGVDVLTLIDPTNTSHVGAETQGVLGEIPTGGTNSSGVAVDPPSNVALVVNTGSDNVSVIGLGGNVRTPQISEIRIPLSRRLFAQGTSFTAGSPAPDLPVQIFGAGFTGSPQVRLDGTVIGVGTLVGGLGREIDVTIPAAFLTAPHRFALDVMQGASFSNVLDFTVAEKIPLTNTGCAAPQPTALAVDETRDLAVVANIACNNASVVNLNTGTVSAPIAVGTAPGGVAVIPRLGLAVVTNSNINVSTGIANAAGSASIIDLTQNVVTATPALALVPSGVAINQDTGMAYIVNSGTNTLSGLDLTTASPTATTGATDLRPVSVAIDPERKVALVGALNAASTTGTGIIDVIDISAGAPGTTKTTIGSGSLPGGLVFDPITSLFYAAASLSNSLLVVNPDTAVGTPVRVGVSPTSLAFNPQTGTVITVNAASNTISFVDVQSLTTRATIGFGTPPPPTILNNPQFAVAIHTRKNLAVIADASNNLLLAFPLP